MKHSNISIFVPHIGCPNMCSFCNQHTISGAEKAPTAEEVRSICSKAFSEIESPENTEIAFFGGSFTAIPKSYMIQLLEAASAFTGKGKFKGIRISTRPDYIDDAVLELLKKYRVTAIELGAQSLDDTVLEANNRGHSSEDVVRACELIRKYDFDLGLQMMTGLYKSSFEADKATAERINELHPDTVRIYPVVVLTGTKLGELFESGEYEMYTLDEMVRFCAKLVTFFEESDIRVIKCGLHASEFVEKDKVAGYYHPAFRELCEMYIYREAIEKELAGYKTDKQIIAEVNDKCISKAVGQRKANIEFFRQNGFDLSIKGNSEIDVYKCRIRR